MNIYPMDEKFRAFGWTVLETDGHSIPQLIHAVELAKCSDKPVFILCHTTKGKGVSFMEGQVDWHGKAPNDEEYQIAMADLERIGEALCQK